MSVIISNGSTSLNTASGFYKCVAYNLSSFSTTYLALSTTPRYISITPSDACNALGAIIYLQSGNFSNSNPTQGATINLQQIFTPITTSVASPCVVTFTSHGLTDGSECVFTTTGALPTGITSGTIYYSRSTGANTFNLYDTQTHALAGGATGIINTSGTQSGTHTMWGTRATKTFTAAEIVNNETSKVGTWIVPFTFTSSYAVDTTAGKWRLMILGGTGGASANWQIKTSDATNATYAVWGDVAATFSSGNDCVICKDVVTIDQTATFKGVLGTGDTTNSVCGIICKGTSSVADTMSNLIWQNPPVSSYTLTLDGMCILGSHSGFRVGTSVSPIANAQQAIILGKSSPTSGTTKGGLFDTGGTAGHYNNHRGGVFLYGAIPTRTFDTLASDAATGQKTVITTNSTGWSNGDTVFIGKENVKGTGDRTANTIASISTTSIALTNNIAGQNRLAGGIIMNINGYGIKVGSDSTTSVPWYTNVPVHFQCSGVYFYQMAWTINYNTDFTQDSNNTQWSITDCAYYHSNSSSSIFSGFYSAESGLLIQRVNGIGCGILKSYSKYSAFDASSNPHSLGTMTVKDNNVIHSYGYSPLNPVNEVPVTVTIDEENNTYQNIPWGIDLWGFGSTFKNNRVWGTSDDIRGGLNMCSMISPVEISGNYVDNCLLGWTMSGSRVAIDVRETGNVFGSVAANTTDMSFSTGSYFDIEEIDLTGVNNLSTTNLPYNVVGSNLKFTNFNSTAGDDRGYLPYGLFQKTGDGLTDTTVHTSGTGKFAIRFQPTSSTNNLTWSFNVPTGNIQSKTMTVAIWCKINNSAFYAGTHQNPRLTVNYDNGTEVYTEAVNSTDWQLIPVTFSPITTYGQITVTLSGRTDATSTNAYLYWDDINILYPAGYQLDLGALDLWAHALPVTPPVATNLSAQSVWTASTSVDYGANTMGNRVKVLKNPSAIIDGEIIV